MGRHFIGLHEAVENYGERTMDVMGQFIDAADVVRPHDCVEECDDEPSLIDFAHGPRRAM